MLKKIFCIAVIMLSIAFGIKANTEINMGEVRQDSSELNMKKFGEGVDFYATGNEPFWNLDLALNQFIHFNLFEGPSIKLGSVKGEKAMDADVTRYQAKTDSGLFTLTIFKQECFDDMSGDTFTCKVIVELNDPLDKNYKKYEGCGRYIPDYKLNRNWILKKLGDKDVNENDYKNGMPSVSFDIGKNRFSGSGGCNRILGAVNAEGGTLKFGNVASTMMACSNLDLEKEFLTALGNTVNYKLIGNQLILADPDKVLMVLYDPDMEVRERTSDNSAADYRLNDIWVLESINNSPAESKNYMKGLPRIEINLNEMRFSGNGGCNSINGKVETSGDKIKFGPVASTRMMCPGNFETDFLNALNNSDSFTIENNRLSLISDGKILVVFKKVD